MFEPGSKHTQLLWALLFAGASTALFVSLLIKTLNPAEMSQNQLAQLVPTQPVPIGLLNNGSFESGTANWTGFSRDEAIVTDIRYDGLKSVRFYDAGAETRNINQTIAVSPKSYYVVSSYVKTSLIDVDQEARIVLEWLSASASVISSQKVNQVNSNQNWVEKNTTVISPSDAVRVRINLELTPTTNRSNDGIAWFDYVLFDPASMPTSIPTPPPPITPTPTPPPPPPPLSNLIINGNFESDKASWLGWSSDESIVTDIRSDGTKALRFYDGCCSFRNVNQTVSVSPLTKYTLSASVKTSALDPVNGMSDPQEAHIKLEWLDQSNYVVRTQIILQSYINTEWTKKSYNVTSPQNASKVRINLELTNTNNKSNDGVAWFDQISLTQSLAELVGPPSNPTPQDGAAGVPTNTKISWAAGLGAVAHDVYFGNVNPPMLVASRISATSYNPGLLRENTKYYWRIVEWGAREGLTVGPIWSFTTLGSNPGLIISAGSEVAPSLLLKGAKNIPFTRVKLYAKNADVTINSFTIERTGLSSDVVLTAVKILDENGNQIGTSALDSSHRAVIKGLFMIKVGGMREITIAGDASNIFSELDNGTTVNLSLTGLGTSAAIEGSLPIANRNVQTVSAGISLGSLTVENPFIVLPVYIPPGTQNATLGVYRIFATGSNFVSSSAKVFVRVTGSGGGVAQLTDMKIYNQGNIMAGPFNIVSTSSPSMGEVDFRDKFIMNQGSTSLYVKGNVGSGFIDSQTIRISLHPRNDLQITNQSYGFMIYAAPDKYIRSQLFTIRSNVNNAPTVDIGLPHELTPGVLHQHSGASASDVDGNLDTYSWKYISCPGGLDACPVLSGASGFIGGKFSFINGPKFTPNAGGDYVLQLTVQDDTGLSTSEILTEKASDPFVLDIINPGPQTAVQGGLVTIPIQVQMTGPSGKVTFSAPNLGPGNPIGIAGFSPMSCSSSCTTTLHVFVYDYTPLQTESVIVTGIGPGGINKSIEFPFSVKSQSTVAYPPYFDFKLESALPSLQGIVSPGGVLSPKLTVKTTGGFGGLVSFSSESVPQGPSVTFAPSTACNPYSTSCYTYVSIRIPSTLPTGQYIIKVKGTTDNGLMRHLRLVIFVESLAADAKKLFALPLPIAANPGIELFWEDGSGAETGFQVERSISPLFSSVQSISLPANTTSYRDFTSIVPNTEYYYRVRALGTSMSAYSNTAPTKAILPPPANGYITKIAYFIPSDYARIPNDIERLQTVARMIQHYYAINLWRHGFGYTPDNLEVDPVTGLPKIYWYQSPNPKSYFWGPANCHDGIDNDNDGTADMEDWNCQARDWNEFHNGNNPLHSFNEEAEFKRLFTNTDKDTVVFISPLSPAVGGGDAWEGDEGDYGPNVRTAGATVPAMLESFCNTNPFDHPFGAGWNLGQKLSAWMGGWAHELGHAYGGQHLDDLGDYNGAGFYELSGAFNNCYSPNNIVKEPPMYLDNALVLINNRNFRPETTYSDITPPAVVVKAPYYLRPGESYTAKITVADDESGPAVLMYSQGKAPSAMRGFSDKFDGGGASATKVYTFNAANPYDQTPLAPGTAVMLNLLAFDKSNNVSDSTNAGRYTYKVVDTLPPPDNIPPQTPTASYSVKSCSNVELLWNEVGDDLAGYGIAGFSIYRNGILRNHFHTSFLAWYEPTPTSWIDNVEPGKTYTYQIAAVDNAGNEAPSTAMTVTLPQCH